MINLHTAHHLLKILKIGNPSADGENLKISPGFTLIELIIVIGIGMLLVGGGIASFVTFNDKQTLMGGVRELQSALRQAQLKAQLGDKPAGCDKLEGYVVTANQSPPVVVQVLARCQNGDVVRSTPFTLASSLSLESALSITFSVLHGGVLNPTTVIVNSATGYSYEFEVSRGGEITNGEYVSDEEEQTASPSPSPSGGASPSPSPSPSSSPSPSPTASPIVVILNAATGQSCTQRCTANGYSQCLSIGMDASGTGNTYAYSSIWGACLSSSGSCSTAMTSSNKDACSGSVPFWTNCRCQ